jgi:hypothetical protein
VRTFDADTHPAGVETGEMTPDGLDRGHAFAGGGYFLAAMM